jgi:hypothetical protein
MPRALGAVALLSAVACSSPDGGRAPAPPPTAADAAVDERPGPATLPQGSFTGTSAACGDLFAYRTTDDGTQVLGVTFAGPPPDGELDLGREPEGVAVTVDVFADPPSALSCEQLARGAGAKTTWSAEAGRLRIESSGGERTIRLDDVHLVGPPRGIAIVVPSVVIEHVRPGA